MILNSQYNGRSAIVNGLNQADVNFATNLLREPTYFEGQLGHPVLFREALAALHDVVVSDYKYRPKDRLEFQEWLRKEDEKFLATLQLQNEQIRHRLEQLELRKSELEAQRLERMKPFHHARRRFFEHIYYNWFELTLLLDPVITVHPDEMSFEAFSRDESTYARLAAKYDLFQKVNSFECGTTNIDFSLKLHQELERMRSYRRTHFAVNPTGFTVSTEDTGRSLKEKKIELPDSWKEGFLQVHAIMSMGLTRISMQPVELHNICRYLKRHKAKTSPRSLRYELTPGRKVRVVIEPWNHEIELTDSPVYAGPKQDSIRTWGRDRLKVLARLLPVCKRVNVYLAGYGLPSIYVLDLGPITFTLGLSGWTDNDWTGSSGTFDLLTRRANVTAGQLMQVYETLRSLRVATDQQLAGEAKLDLEKCRSAVSYLCQNGRAMLDLGSNSFRHRDLFQSPFTMKEAEKAVQSQSDESKNPQAQAARAIYEVGNAMLIARRPVSTGWKLSGSVKGTDQNRVRPMLHVDHDSKIIEATCTCPYFKSNKLTKGPCEHMLALRLVHMQRLESESG